MGALMGKGEIAPCVRLRLALPVSREVLRTNSQMRVGGHEAALPKKVAQFQENCRKSSGSELQSDSSTEGEGRDAVEAQQAADTSHKVALLFLVLFSCLLSFLLSNVTPSNLLLSLCTTQR